MARILVIDDEKNIRTMVGLALKHEGYAVDLAEDGRSGLNTFGGGEDFDLVLLDQRMPELDGLEVLHEMRRRKPDTRVVMITAFGTIELAVDAMKSGAADFLRCRGGDHLTRGGRFCRLDRMAGAGGHPLSGGRFYRFQSLQCHFQVTHLLIPTAQ